MLTFGEAALLIAAVFGTSILSGVFGMAGGLILMGILASFLPVPVAMVAHGFAQLIANATRFLSLIEHVHWRGCGYYLIGASAAGVCFWFIAFTPSPGLLFLSLGALPFLAFIPNAPKFDFAKPGHAILSGILNTSAHLTAGVSGPILDLFFVHSRMNRFEIIATKACTQTIGHAMKIGYFATLSSALLDLPLWQPLAIAASAIVGTRLGGQILHKMSDTHFRKGLKLLLALIGGFYLFRGAMEFI